MMKEKNLHAPGHSYGLFCNALTCLDNEYFNTLKCKVGPSGWRPSLNTTLLLVCDIAIICVTPNWPATAA